MGEVFTESDRGKMPTGALLQESSVLDKEMNKESKDFFFGPPLTLASTNFTGGSFNLANPRFP